MKMFILAIIIVLLSGCALTEFARDYLVDVVDTSLYDESKEIDDLICDADILAKLKNNHTAAWYKEVSAGCE